MGSCISGFTGNGSWKEKPFTCLLLNPKSHPHLSSAANPFLGQRLQGSGTQSTDILGKGSFVVVHREPLFHAGSGGLVLEKLGLHCPSTQTCFLHHWV